MRRLSLAVDHLSYLRTAKPFLAGCIAYWLWEHEGVRAHVGELAQGAGALVVREGGSTGDELPGVAGPGALVEEGRPAREAFLAAAEEFLRVEALLTGHQEGGSGRRRRGGGGGGLGAARGGGGSDVSFMSLLTEGAMQRCPWPGAWDRWVEECLRDAQVGV